MTKRTTLYITLALFFIILTGTVYSATQPQAAEHMTPHPAGCKPGEVFLSAQDWWVNATGEEVDPQTGKLADDFGHIHTEVCFPHMATVSGEITFEVKHVMHHNPGKFNRFMVQIFNRSEVIRSPRLCKDNHAYVCLQFNPPRTIDNCEETGGRYGDNQQTCIWKDVVTIDTSEFPYDGWQQIRFRAFVKEPDGEDGRTSTGLQVKLDNGQPYKDAYPNTFDHIEARGWYGHDVNYTTARIDNIPLSPVSGLWEPKVYLRRGSEGIPVTSHAAYVDANFHQEYKGWILREGDGPYEGRLKIDTTKLANGWHRLVLKADALSNRGSTNSALGAMLFEVANDPPCEEDCWPAIGTTPIETGPTHPADCQSGEVYLSTQAWWTNASGEAINPHTNELATDFGQVHTELCFPHLVTISGNITFHVNNTLYQNPGEFHKFMVQIFNHDGVDRDPRLCHDDHAYTCVIFDPPRTIENCEETGGRVGAEGQSCTWTDTVTVHTADFPYDGWQQFRFRAFVKEPDGIDSRTSTGLHAFLQNDRPYRDAYPNQVDQIETRAWHGEVVNFTTTRIDEIPLAPVFGWWEPQVYLRPGVDGIPVTSYAVYIDADFQADYMGWVIVEGEGEFVDSMAVDTTKLENGWHRLVLRANALSEGGSTHSAVGELMFEVENDPPCTAACWPAIDAESVASPLELSALNATAHGRVIHFGIDPLSMTPEVPPIE